MFIEAELYMQKNQKKTNPEKMTLQKDGQTDQWRLIQIQHRGSTKSVKKKKKKKTSTEINKEYEIFCYFKDWSIKETKMWIMGLMQYI